MTERHSENLGARCCRLPVHIDSMVLILHPSLVCQYTGLPSPMIPLIEADAEEAPRCRGSFNRPLIPMADARGSRFGHDLLGLSSPMQEP
jgi:hypothetical protein